VVAQFNGYCPLAGLCLNGKQVLTENIADLAALLVAHGAYVLSQRGKLDIAVCGLTGEQRFFWRSPRDGGSSKPKPYCARRSLRTRILRENIAPIPCATSMRGTTLTRSRPSTSCI
jgi:hypothetical protein